MGPLLFETQPWWILDNRGKNIDYEVTELCFQELFFSTQNSIELQSASIDLVANITPVRELPNLTMDSTHQTNFHAPLASFSAPSSQHLFSELSQLSVSPMKNTRIYKLQEL